MQRHKEFGLFEIAGVPYLLPFGQQIADHKRGVRINDTGRYIWQLLGENLTMDELSTRFLAHYEASGPEIPQLKDDLKQFLELLDSYGLLQKTVCPESDSSENHLSKAELQLLSKLPDDRGTLSKSDAAPVRFGDFDHTDEPIQRYLTIGGMTLLLIGPKEAFAEELEAFETASPSSVDQTVTVISHAPTMQPTGRLLIQNAELSVIQGESHYLFLFPAAGELYGAQLSLDGKKAVYYCKPPYTEALRQDLFHAIRLSFLYLAQLNDMIILHSASLLYRDKAWLFSGHSGAGKSTHTHLWKEAFDVPLINGDLNLLSMRGDRPVVHGLPWCGTSGISDTRTYPLGGIFLIKKSSQNQAVTLSQDQAQLLVTQRLISPNWTEAMVAENLRLTAKMAIDDYLDTQNGERL